MKAQQSGSAQIPDAKDEMHEGSKVQVLLAAIKLFSERGYHAVAVREIVEEARVTKPVLYYYFGNKEGLFRAIVEGALKRFESEVAMVVEEECFSIQDALQKINHLVMDSAVESPELVRLMNAVSFSGLYDDLFDFQRYWLKVMSGIENLFEQAQNRGEIRQDVDCAVLAHHYMGMAINTNRYRVYMPDFPQTAKMQDRLIDVFLEGVRNREEIS